MESPAPPAMMQHLWKSTLLSGILAVILGILVLAWPGKTIVVAAIFFGAYLLITGISQVIFAFSLHVSAGGRVLLFISGAALPQFRHDKTLAVPWKGTSIGPLSRDRIGWNRGWTR